MDQLPITNALSAQSQASGSGTEVAALLGAATPGADQPFGLLLSKQLQQLLAQVGGVEALAGNTDAQAEITDPSAGKGLMARDRALSRGDAADVALGLGLTEDDAESDAAMLDMSGLDEAMPKAFGLNAQLALGRDADAEKGRGHGGPGEDGPWHSSLTTRSGLALAIGRKEESDDAGGKKLPLELPQEGDESPVVAVDQAALAATAQVSAGMLAQAAKNAIKPGEEGRSADSAIDGFKASAGKEIMLSKVEPRALADTDALPNLTQPQAAPQSFSTMLTERTSGHHPQTPATPSLEVPYRVDTPQWSNSLGDKVVWMLGSQTQGAELRLNPPALGPLEVRVSMSDGQATLSFMTPHAPVREAIEAAAPRLREMLGDSGINLGSVSVNVGTFSQQQPGSQNPADERQHAAAGQWKTDFNEQEGGSAAGAALVSSVRYLRDGGMVDLFA